MIYEIIHFKYIFEVHELEITPSKGQSMIYVYKTYMLHNIMPFLFTEKTLIPGLQICI